MVNFIKEKFQILGKRSVSNMKITFLMLFAAAALAALVCPSLVSALPILGDELASFAVLGASTVTNTGATTLTGNLGVSPGSSITNAGSLTLTGVVHQTDPFAALAQSQLVTARNNLASLGGGTLLGADLSGLTLTPGVYTVAAGTTNLSGTLTLDGGGNANAFWVFQMLSTLITSPGSVVNVTNTGLGAGLFWNVGSSATLDTSTSFEGNILALTSITLNTGATIGCGRALANTGAVTMDTNTIGGACTDILAGSSGLNGGLDVITTPGGGTEVIPLPPESTAPVPEPGTFLLLGFGLAGLVAFRKRFQKD